jgi:hypothetical protein
MSQQTRWSIKFPRKPRACAQKEVDRKPPPLTLLSSCGLLSTTISRGIRRPAAAPVETHEQQSLPSKCDRASVEKFSDHVGTARLADRFKCGRTSENLLSILHCNPFIPMSCDGHPAVHRASCAARGLTATLEGRPVFIVDTLLRFNEPCADVGFLTQSDTDHSGVATFLLGRLTTVKAACLEHVRFEFVVMKATGSTLLLSRSSVCEPKSAVAVLGYCDASDVHVPVEKFGQKIDIVPAAATAHTAKYGNTSAPHRTVPVNRHADPQWVLDIPISHQFGARPHRCTTCQNSATEASRVECGEASYFPVTDEDVKRTFPHAIVVTPPRKKTYYMTVRYLMEMLLLFWACLNARAVRRSMVSIVSANVLAFQQWMHGAGLSPYTIAWQISAVPSSQAVRYIVLNAFNAFIGGVVEAFKEKQFVYNGTGIRHDGNYGIAIRVIVPGVREGRRRLGRRRRLLGRRKRQGKVVIAFTGLDGSLLVPPAIVSTESWPDIDSLLKPLLDELKAARLRAGCCLELIILYNFSWWQQGVRELCLCVFVFDC